ncbi:MAG: class I SAM-dependent methyltransferase [Rhodobacteraceae bacterium]|nr:class I SAM-dependent methyltransferase [Paracoccaceae bacterium]
MIKAVKTRDLFYSAALARAHSEVYSDTFEPGFNWLASQIKDAPGPAQLFDIGCGDGTWLAAARDMNITGQGIDTSPDFVSIAVAKGLNVTNETAMQARAPKGTNAVTALGEVLAYKPASLAPTALNMARSLPKGGVFIFDLPGPDMVQKVASSEGDDWQLTSRTFISGKSLSRQITIDGPEGRIEETHYQHLFSDKEVSGILTGFGYDVEILTSYGPCEFLPGRFAVLARKQ